MKTAVVTGASRGIGLAIVKVLLSSNYRVAAWSRSAIPLEKSEHLLLCKVDVTNEESVYAGWDRTLERFEKIDALINNAGLGYEGLFEELGVEKWKEMFDVNVNGLYYCTRAVLPHLKKNNAGHVINISSVAGHTGIAGMAGYCGTKFAIKGISQALMKEVRKYGIKVTCIYPGAVNTDFFDGIESVESNNTMMDATQIAEAVLNCLNTPPNLHYVDLDIRPLFNKVSK